MARVIYNKVSAEAFDRVLKGGWISPVKIAGMSYTQLTKLVTSGRVSVKELKSAYTQLRTAAKSRERTVSKEDVQQQFGDFEENNFRQLKNLVTTSELLHELADVGRFLRGDRSTITGLKKQRSYLIDIMSREGFDIDESNYRDFKEFMKWFRASEYAKLYDSDSEEVGEVFNSGATTREDWEELFREISSRGAAAPAVRQY